VEGVVVGRVAAFIVEDAEGDADRREEAEDVFDYNDSVVLDVSKTYLLRGLLQRLLFQIEASHLILIKEIA
jgi:hypothetical protein